MAEALHAVLEFGFETMNLNRIQAIVISNNLPSAKLLQQFEIKLATKKIK
jgi:RimJ/RimL family protein N-acetyltransferase